MNTHLRINIREIIIVIIYFLSIFFVLLKMYGSVNYISPRIVSISYIIELIIVFLSIAFLFFQINNRIIKFSGFIFLLVVFGLYELFIGYITFSLYFPYYIIDLLTWPLLLIVFIYFCSKNEIPLIIRKSIFIIYLIIIFFSIMIIGKKRVELNDGSYIYYTYFSVTFLPLLLKLLRNNKIKLLSIIMSIIILLFANKRAGFIALVVGLLFYMLFTVYIQPQSKEKIKNQILIVSIIILSFVIIKYIAIHGNVLLFKRFETLLQDGGSDRNLIWKSIINSYSNSNVIKKMIGHGFQSVYYQLHPLGNYSMAHNSFLEYLYDYGIIGLVLLISIVIGFIRKSLKYLKLKSNNSPLMFMSDGIIITLSMFSYFFEQSVIILPIAIFWGICLGEEYKKDVVES